MTHLKSGFFTTLSLTLVATPALAERGGPPDSGPAASPGAERGAYEHDGFYLRLGTGFGGFADVVSATEEGEDGHHSEAQVTGIASASELMLGGAISRNWILGGGVWTSTLLASDYSHEAGAELPNELRRPDNFTLVGPFADFYVGGNPRFARRGAFHFQGGLAFAVLNGFRPDPADFDGDRRVGVGAGLMLGAGYEWWVDEQWGLGVLGRMTAAGLLESDSEDEMWAHGVATFPAFLFTATYN
jgi:hypothetical protein